MDEAAKDQPQVRRVGRPRKVEIVADVTFTNQVALASTVVAVDPRAQALAQRIWDGQSPDTLSRAERLDRVRKGLEAQGLSMEGVKL